MDETTKKMTEKAAKPGQDALIMHPFYRGKIEVSAKAPVRNMDDFSIWYSPGVAAPCKAIAENRDLAYEHTLKWNAVAVVSDGTRVLGLGNIGPEAGLPVMEGKAMLFKYLGGVDAFPICLETTDAEEIIKAVKWLQPTFGGINLEDIESPKCFYILERLRAECRIPVWHDDQQGTAAINLAGLYNALKVVGKEIGNVKVAMVGSGAAGIRTAMILIKAGVDPAKIVMCDVNGTLHKGREDFKGFHKEAWELCNITNGEGVVGGTAEAMKGADVVMAMSKPGPGTILKEWVAGMAKDAIVFACANPTPEIWPWEAKEAGAMVVATGRSDFPNQVNNSLVFPGIFRGALDVRATAITDEMCIAGAQELASYQEKNGIDADHILPSMSDWEVPAHIAAAVGAKAVEQGVAKLNRTKEEILMSALELISRSRMATKYAMEHGIIKPAPEL